MADISADNDEIVLERVVELDYSADRVSLLYDDRSFVCAEWREE
jgi:hypothetical protein